jgi:hypothetical protein
MPQREELHQLIELIPAHELHTALRFMQFLCGVSAAAAKVIVVDDPNHAPDLPETPEEQAAWRDYEANLAKLPPLDREIEALDAE